MRCTLAHMGVLPVGGVSDQSVGTAGVASALATLAGALGVAGALVKAR